MHSIKDTVKQLIGKSLDAYNKKYTSPINNRIDNIVAQAGTDNTEIVDARIDSAGVSHTTLNNRILAETKMTDEKLIEYTGSSLSVDDTMPGYLQNIEIKGNTIQNEDNLEDIRSVGNKIEGQEIYEIPVLSCGKNIFNGEVERGCITGSGELVNWGNYVRAKSFTRVSPNTNYTGHMKYNGQIKKNGYYVEYDKDFNFIKTSFSNNGITTSDSSCYMKLILDSNSDPCDLTLVSDIQLEEGTVATPYEPYQEDKLTILSPVQLEKVGDVSDRIIEKDGVWGVEKNIVTYYPNVNKIYNYLSMENSFRVSSNSADAIVTPKTSRSICNLLIEGVGSDWTSDKQCCYVLTNNTLVIKGDIRNASNLEEARKWIKSSGLYIKYPTTNPQFIPLPHDQQVKLRTFANKTNISFGCEIEGTIKAQVPKSIDATVDTHTKQINNLNNELNRVKKLEESTVSTVTTESDFTTVEATSNGYFEDVKLEGKTLVNHIDFATRISANNFAISGGVVTLTNNGSWGAVRLPIPATLKTNTKYTIILNILENTTGANFYYLDNNVTTSAFKSSAYLGTDSKGIITQLVETIDDFSGRNIGMRTDSDAGYVKFTYMLLEGDHTQNPPSYFEGLKSVGQGTDEIVVSSVNENLLKPLHTGQNIQHLKNVAFENDYSINYYAEKWGSGFTVEVLGVVQGETYVVKCDSVSNGVFKGVPGSALATSNDVSIYSGRAEIVATSSGKGLIQFKNATEVGNISFTNLRVVKKGSDETFKPQISDKKRLLFYNNETQSWEKPVLREWDSIEKHADGKYYYHQRSAEVVLNGSEGWSGNYVFENTGRWACQIPNMRENSLLVCDKFINKSNDNGGAESIFATNKLLLTLSNDKGNPNTWLQANNVTVVYQLAEEKVYECTNIDLITYANETNYIVECGAIAPKSTLKVHNNISNVVSLLQKKVSLLESNITNYMITQNRMQLASTYSADSVTFKVDYALCSEEVEYNEDLYNLILNNILVGKDNYDYDKMFTMILDYASWNQISWEQFDILVGLMDMQHNPPVEDEIVEEIPNEVM